MFNDIAIFKSFRPFSAPLSPDELRFNLLLWTKYRVRFEIPPKVGRSDNGGNVLNMPMKMRATVRNCVNSIWLVTSLGKQQY